jgi:hypothetical protein
MQPQVYYQIKKLVIKKVVWAMSNFIPFIYCAGVVMEDLQIAYNLEVPPNLFHAFVHLNLPIP